jgi:hypothetical protein
MNVQRNLRSRRRKFREGRDADDHVVTDTVRFHNRLIGMLDQQSSAKMRNHSALLYRVAPAPSPARLRAGPRRLSSGAAPPTQSNTRIQKLPAFPDASTRIAHSPQFLHSPSTPLLLFLHLPSRKLLSSQSADILKLCRFRFALPVIPRG